MSADSRQSGGSNAEPQARSPLLARKPLRLWPGVAVLLLQWVAWFVVPPLIPEIGLTSMMVGMGCGLVIVLWWLLLSRAPWTERLAGVAMVAAAVYLSTLFVHPSIANGMRGMMPKIFSIPFVSLGLVAWAVLARGLTGGVRWASLVGAMLLASVPLAVLRTSGVTGGSRSELHWRWSATPEERLLAVAAREGEPPVAALSNADDSPAASAPGAVPAETATVPPPDQPASVDPQRLESSEASAVAQTGSATVQVGPSTGSAVDPTETPLAASVAANTVAEADRVPEWPGYRGPARDGQVRGVRIATNWTVAPPVELWRRPVGPGWSSFAVDGDFVYTQEQRGEEELVSCYRAATGEPVWHHRDTARFWESNAGAGPRATPTLHGGRVYTLGGTGLVNALDAADGSVVWTRDAAVDTGAKAPYWGFSGSPLVVGELVVVAASGRLIAYQKATGEPRWQGPASGTSYCSPHLANINGVAQILMVAQEGLSAVAPVDGALLWTHNWPGYPMVHPAFTADGDLLFAASREGGLRRLAVTHGPAGWSAVERWTSIGLKPYFNDFVVHQGHAYGFDGTMLAAVDLADGKRRWKGGRYGQGQLLLLPDQGLLLVLSEKGLLALVEASPEGFSELARHPAINGKTWNHPVLVGDLLLVRNAEEMAAFRLPVPAG